jgi:hypothetical protein
MSLADLTAAMPLENKRFPGTSLTFDDVRGCTGQHLVKRILQAAVMRWQLDFKVTPTILAGAASLLYGAAANPTGSPADEAQLLTVDATSGTFTILFSFEGLSAESVPIAFNATPAVVKAALEAMRSIKPGNVTTSGTLSGGMTITFTGDLAKANVPALTTNASLLVGGAATATISTTTPGVQRSHAITRQTGEQGASIDVVVGFDGAPETYLLYSQIVANDLRVTAQRRQNVTATLGVRGSAKVVAVPDFIMPACQSQAVIKAAQCRAQVDGSFISDLVKMEYNASAGVLDGDDAVPFDDPHVERLEQGEQWQPVYSIDTYGSNADTLFALGKANAEKAVALHFGNPGDRVSFSASNAFLQLPDDELGFSGQANRSTISLTATPLEVSGAAPDIVTAKVAQATAFLSV